MLTETIFIPLSIIEACVTAAEWPVKVTGQVPFSADQILSLISAPDVKATTPEGNNFTEYMSPECPSSFLYHTIERKLNINLVSKYGNRRLQV